MRWPIPILLALAACDASASASAPRLEARAAFGSGSQGPLATRVAPHRRRIRAMAGRPVHLRLAATDAQNDLSGADLYLDGVLIAQEHVAEVGGGGTAATFDFSVAALAPGAHELVAKAFDRGDHYSEGVTWNVQVQARRRALYVSRLRDQLLEHPAAQAQLLGFVAAHAVDAIVFYGLNATLSEGERDELAAFAHELRRAGAAEVGAAVGAGSLPILEAFNQAHPNDAFDLAVIEDEYWLECNEPAHGYDHECASCRSACFPPFLALLRTARELSEREALAGRPLTLAAYLGYPSGDEAEQAAAYLDRVFLNYHGADPGAAYDRAYTRWGSMRARLQRFAGGERSVEVWPIFYACGEASMHAWLDANSLDAGEDVFLDRLDAEAAPFVDDLVVPGFAYYRYGALASEACAEAIP